ncbi:MAG: glycosyltransferase family 39 protein [Aggregatilineales bacterium]
MLLPYWIVETLAGTPAFLWVFLGLGLPWALVVLPRADWGRRSHLLALSLALGPAFLTVWMFILGTIGGTQETTLLTIENTFAGTVVIAVVGLLIALRRRREPFEPVQQLRFDADELLLLALIGIALVVRWLVIAYWPFTAYDTLWVYGYQGRLYTLLGYIPESIGYYPPFLSLQYAFGQLAYGAINDHAARAVLLPLHAAAIAATYILGTRLFDRRTGVFAAALWAFYPHVGEWSRAGDLEIPLTMLFTLAAAFFLAAWIGARPRAHYALLAGLMLSIALWTKPTAGAFVWGLALVALIELLRVRFDLRAAWPRLRLIMLAGLAAVPLGGLWYLRNIALGHSPIDFPPAYWLTLAERSGAEFGWPLLGLIIYLVYVHSGPLRPRPDARWTVAGFALVLAGLLPSIVFPRRMDLLDWLLLAIGALLLAIALGRHARAVWTAPQHAAAARLGWGLALALPYFVTWFYSYSYHYRLSFAIVPLLLLPSALVLARWFSHERVAKWPGARRLAYSAALIALALPGIVSPIYDINAGWDYLWSDALPDDRERYRSGNAALMAVVDGLEVYQREWPGEPLVVTAPRVDRLPFFFPLEDIRVDTAPTQLAQLDDVIYFVYGLPESAGAYFEVPPLENQVVGALGREDIIRRAWGYDDGIFRYEVYELHQRSRFEMPFINGPAAEEILVGDFVRYLGYDIGGFELWPGRRVIMHLFWEVLSSADQDYSIFVHLLDADGRLLANWDGPMAEAEFGYYSTLVWEPGEILADRRVLSLPDGIAPRDETLRLVVGFYDPLRNERLPVSINGVPAGDSILVEDRMVIQAAPS